MSINKSKIVNDILHSFNISFEQLYFYKNSNSELINKYDELFEKKDIESKKIIANIPKLLVPELSSDLCSFYAKEYDLVTITISEDDKLALITALVFNNNFFAMAYNWCSYLNFEMQKSLMSPSCKDINDSNGYYAKVAEPKLIMYTINSDFDYIAATSSGSKLIIDPPISIKNVGLVKMYSEYFENSIYNIFFKLELDKTGSIPKNIVIQWKTNAEDKYYLSIIKLENEETKQLGYAISEIISCNITKGFKIIDIGIEE